jgi:hypothetical protein
MSDLHRVSFLRWLAVLWTDEGQHPTFHHAAERLYGMICQSWLTW